MVTIKQIAERAGVSTATVSNVLHGKLKKISPETAERVRELIKEMGYSVKTEERRQEPQPKLVAVLVNYHNSFEPSVLSDPFYGNLIGVIQEELRKQDYYMMLYSSLDVEDIFRTLQLWNVAGVIAVSFNGSCLEKLSAMCRRPIISIDRNDPVRNGSVTVPNIGLDDRMGGYLMTRYLLEQGYETIYFCVYSNFGVDARRWKGVVEAERTLDKQGDHQIKLVELGTNQDDREQVYQQLFRQMPFRQKTALFFTADVLAMEASVYLTSHGVRIPQDVGVAGFDNSPFAERYFTPKLTTVNQNVASKGRLAVEELVHAMNDGNYQMKDRLLPVHLVIRNSV